MQYPFLFFTLFSFLTSSLGNTIQPKILGINNAETESAKQVISSAGPIKSHNQISVEIDAKAGIAIDAETGKILFSKNENTSLAMASLTKLMSSLVILSSGKYHPEDQVKISRKAALLRWQGSDIKLNEGETILAKDLLNGILIASANDATCAMAEYIAGSEDDFVSMMNQKAQALGLKNSHFVNSHGLDADNHYSSASDLAQISHELLKFPEFMQIISTEEYEFTSLEPGYYHRFRNTNKLLKLDFLQVLGGKTGFTDNAGLCLMLVGEKNGHKIISIVLGSEDAFLDSKILLDWVDEVYKWQ